MLDTFTINHLDAWIAANVRDEECAMTREAMFAVIADAPDYWADLGWSRVYDEAWHAMSDAK